LNLRPLRPELPAGVPLPGADHAFALWSGNDLWPGTPALPYRLLYVMPVPLLGEGLAESPATWRSDSGPTTDGVPCPGGPADGGTGHDLRSPRL
jgi:hypothetical protein